MSIIGIGKGIFKAIEGALEADAEKALKGVAGAVVSTVGVVVETAIHEEFGRSISEQGEQITEES